MSQAHTKLPLELYRPVLEYVAQVAALYPLLLTSRAINRETERILYRSVSVHSGPDYDEPSKIRSLIRHLANCSRVSSHVHHFSHLLQLRWDPGPLRDDWITFHRALQHMDNLKSLVLGYILSCPDLNPTLSLFVPQPGGKFLLEGCPFQLTSLRCKGLSSDHYSLLSSQSHLEELVFTRPVEGFSLNRQQYPNLRMIGCINQDAGRLVRCLPQVKILELLDGNLLDSDEDAFMDIERLSVHFVPPGQLLFPLLRLFPSLVYFKLTARILRQEVSALSRIIVSSSANLFINQQTFLADCLDQLEFPYLKKLYIKDEEGGSLAFTLKPFRPLFASHTRLEKIVLQSHMVCLELTRGERDLCDVPPTPDEWKGWK